MINIIPNDQAEVHLLR